MPILANRPFRSIGIAILLLPMISATALATEKAALPRWFGETFLAVALVPLAPPPAMMAAIPVPPLRPAIAKRRPATEAALPSIITEGTPEAGSEAPDGSRPVAYAPADVPTPVRRPADFPTLTLPSNTTLSAPKDSVKVAMLGPAAGAVALGDVVRMAALRRIGSGGCSVEKPFAVAAVGPGAGIDLAPDATLNEAMALAFAGWSISVQALATEHLGQPIRSIIVAGSYDCRTMNHIRRARLSEHSRANAIDVGGFVLADGRRITVAADWRAKDERGRFWKAVHAETCRRFGVVLGPGSDGYHENHLHMDLSRWKVCR